MNHWTNGKRWLSLALALTMLASLLCVSASATATTLDEAKASLADVKITQTYGVKPSQTTENNDAKHDVRTAGKEVYLTYGATLTMTNIMAEYLCPRQQQLYDAQFNVNMKVELDWLEFVETGDKLTFTFRSTFLKPVETGNYEVELTDYDKDSKYFTYVITASKAWVLEQWTKNGGVITVPMELIVYYADNVAYNYTDAAKEFPGKSVMFADYTVADWRKPITLTLADLKVKADKIATVTAGNPKTVVASGTVDGEFSYVTAESAPTFGLTARLLEKNAADYTKTLEFGNGKEITEWVSNEVKLTLYYSTGVDPNPNPAEPSDLNTTDHFAYVIGYPDGTVRPDRQITRAEVTTIFFRMLKDEAREKYWSTTNTFTDVAQDDWYNNAISTLTNMGIINGYPDGTFRPNANITRAEFAKIAVSFFKDYVSQTIGDKFSDISGQWYTTYINLAAELNIVNGYPDGTFRPDQQITRAEAMQIVNNTLRRTPHKDKLLPEAEMNTWPDNSDKSIWYYAAVQEATNSHMYSRASFSDYETWTEKLLERDWAAFEKAWSDANSAFNPGEVVDGSGSYLDRD